MKRKMMLNIAAATVVSVAVMLGLPSPATAQSFYEIWFHGSGHCVTVPGSSHQVDLALQLSPCTRSASQLWYFDFVGADGNGNPVWRIRNVNSGLCVSAGLSPARDALHQHPCGGYWQAPRSDLWTFRDVAGASPATKLLVSAWVTDRCMTGHTHIYLELCHQRSQRVSLA